MAIRLENFGPSPSGERGPSDVRIVWKGRRIAKLIFSSGKIVEFDEPVEIGDAAQAPGDRGDSRGDA